jgi:hypothetical protein
MTLPPEEPPQTDAVPGNAPRPGTPLPLALATDNGLQALPRYPDQANHPMPMYRPGSTAYSAPTNPLAIASLTTSIVGLILTMVAIGVVAAIVGIVLGHRAKAQIRWSGEAGSGLATAGIIVGWFAVGYMLIFVVSIVGFIVAGSLSHGE